MIETVVESLQRLPRDRALCAFNVENFDTMYAAISAAAAQQAPVVLAVTIPAAEYLGYGVWVRLVRLLADDLGANVSIHLDHVEDERHARSAIEAGFTGVNLLNEGHVTQDQYFEMAQNLRHDCGSEVSLEFVLGTVGHITDHVSLSGDLPGAEEVVEFWRALSPDILGFDCGSVHGMSERAQSLDHDLICRVVQATNAPLVLHGSSGVHMSDIQTGIQNGIRKINIETALRSRYLSAMTTAVAEGSSVRRKPRAISATVHEAMRAQYEQYIQHFTTSEAS